MVNWEYLQNNMTEINVSNLTDPLKEPSNTLPFLLSNAETTAEGYFGLFIIMAVFFVLTFVIFDKSGDIRLNISRSILISSGFSTIVGLILIISNITSNWVHVMWFFTIFIISTISVYVLKKKGL